VVFTSFFCVLAICIAVRLTIFIIQQKKETVKQMKNKMNSVEKAFHHPFPKIKSCFPFKNRSSFL